MFYKYICSYMITQFFTGIVLVLLFSQWIHEQCLWVTPNMTNFHSVLYELNDCSNWLRILMGCWGNRQLNHFFVDDIEVIKALKGWPNSIFYSSKILILNKPAYVTCHTLLQPKNKIQVILFTVACSITI